MYHTVLLLLLHCATNVPRCSPNSSINVVQINRLIMQNCQVANITKIPIVVVHYHLLLLCAESMSPLSLAHFLFGVTNAPTWGRLNVHCSLYTSILLHHKPRICFYRYLKNCDTLPQDVSTSVICLKRVSLCKKHGVKLLKCLPLRYKAISIFFVDHSNSYFVLYRCSAL